MQEQNLPTPVGAENLPKPVEVSETERAEVSAPSPESAPQQESVAASGDKSVQAAPVMPVANLPQPITKNDDSSDDTKKDTSPPSVADDVDVIQKAWVDKAKRVVNETKNDPYEQERQVSGLQADYQKKRYGKPAEQQG